MNYLMKDIAQLKNKLLMVLVLGLLAGPMAANADPVSVAYDITASNFSDGLFDETPPPLEGFAGSFGFTFEATTGGLIVYEIVPDFVNLSILTTEYTVNNTAIQVNDGDVIAITFGGLPNGPALRESSLDERGHWTKSKSRHISRHICTYYSALHALYGTKS